MPPAEEKRQKLESRAIELSAPTRRSRIADYGTAAADLLDHSAKEEPAAINCKY